jgi:hypothetical protein
VLDTTTRPRTGRTHLQPTRDALAAWIVREHPPKLLIKAVESVLDTLAEQAADWRIREDASPPYREVVDGHAVIEYSVTTTGRLWVLSICGS